jgi:hypothetical protein
MFFMIEFIVQPNINHLQYFLCILQKPPDGGPVVIQKYLVENDCYITRGACFYNDFTIAVYTVVECSFWCIGSN